MDKKPVKQMTDVELKAEYKFWHDAKCWCSRQVEVDGEISRRATAAWRHADVFGETFGAYKWDVESQKFVEVR